MYSGARPRSGSAVQDCGAHDRVGRGCLDRSEGADMRGGVAAGCSPESGSPPSLKRYGGQAGCPSPRQAACGVSQLTFGNDPPKFSFTRAHPWPVGIDIWCRGRDTRCRQFVADWERIQLILIPHPAQRGFCAAGRASDPPGCRWFVPSDVSRANGAPSLSPGHRPGSRPPTRPSAPTGSHLPAITSQPLGWIVGAQADWIVLADHHPGVHNCGHAGLLALRRSPPSEHRPGG